MCSGFSVSGAFIGEGNKSGCMVSARHWALTGCIRLDQEHRVVDRIEVQSRVGNQCSVVTMSLHGDNPGTIVVYHVIGTREDPDGTAAIESAVSEPFRGLVTERRILGENVSNRCAALGLRLLLQRDQRGTQVGRRGEPIDVERLCGGGEC